MAKAAAVNADFRSGCFSVATEWPAMSTNKPDVERIQHAMATSLHNHWVLFLVEGVILVALGLAAIAVPRITTLTVEILFGWLFIISGVVGLITTLWVRQATGFWWSLISAVVGVAAGVIFLVRPLGGILSLSVVLIVFFAIESIASIMLALGQRRRSEQWGWMLMSGIVDLALFILATIVIAGSAGTAAWLLGLMVGISLTFGGCALVAMAFRARE